MTPSVKRILRAAIALQVAAFEWEDLSVNDLEANRGLAVALEEARDAVVKLSRTQR